MKETNEGFKWAMAQETMTDVFENCELIAAARGE